MKVKELIKELQGINPELDVELEIDDGDGNITSWELQTINLKWESLGVVALESDNCILD